jgi:hypothetical protein
VNAFFAALFKAFWEAYFDAYAKFKSASRELPPDADTDARAINIHDAIDRLPEEDRPPGH